MKLVKRVTGLLEVDPDSGKIWLNSISGCLLRVNNLKFENDMEKFTTIDIRDNVAVFHNSSLESDIEFELFINNLIDTISLEKINLSPESITKLYDMTKKNLLENINLLRKQENGNN